MYTHKRYPWSIYVHINTHAQTHSSLIYTHTQTYLVPLYIHTQSGYLLHTRSPIHTQSSPWWLFWQLVSAHPNLVDVPVFTCVCICVCMCMWCMCLSVQLGTLNRTGDHHTTLMSKILAQALGTSPLLSNADDKEQTIVQGPDRVEGSAMDSNVPLLCGPQYSPPVWTLHAPLQCRPTCYPPVWTLQSFHTCFP